MSSFGRSFTTNSNPGSPRDVKNRSKFVKRSNQKAENHASPGDKAIQRVAKYKSTDSAKTEDLKPTLTEKEKAEIFNNKLQALHHILESDLKACDAKWTLFVAAALSYRYDIRLNPFPAQYLDKTAGNNIDAVILVIQKTPKLCVVRQYITENNRDKLIEEDVIELLHWVLIEMRQFHLRTLDDNDTENLILSIDNKAEIIKPIYAFEVMTPQDKVPSNEQHSQNCTDNIVKMAFCNNKLDTFYCLMSNGFKESTATVCSQSIGQMFKLTNDFNNILTCSSLNPGWGASRFGPLISCTAICEYKFEEDDINVSPITYENNGKFFVHFDSKCTEVPRLRYIIFHGVLPQPKTICINNGNSPNWFSRYRHGLFFCIYVVLMLLIIAPHDHFATLRTYITEKSNMIVEYCKHIFAFD